MTRSTLTAWWQHWPEEVAQRFDFRTQLLRLRAGWLQLQHARLQHRHTSLQIHIVSLQLESLRQQFDLSDMEVRYLRLKGEQLTRLLPVLRPLQQVPDEVGQVFDVAHAAQPASAAAPVNGSLSQL